jgi:hypothetical protein
MENKITCPTCNYSIQTPIFHCLRCGRRLLKEINPEGTQIVLRFEGDVVRTLAVFYQQQPARIESLEISGANIVLVLEHGISLPQETASLFGALKKGEELWEVS